MQGYESVILMHVSVFSPRAEGITRKIRLQTNSQPTELEHLIPGWGITILNLGISLSNYITNLMILDTTYMHLPKGRELNLSLFGFFNCLNPHGYFAVALL